MPPPPELLAGPKGEGRAAPVPALRFAGAGCVAGPGAECRGRFSHWKGGSGKAPRAEQALEPPAGVDVAVSSELGAPSDVAAAGARDRARGRGLSGKSQQRGGGPKSSGWRGHGRK
eukprot:13576053-Alexandrium_andersonii.AAC.1